MTSIQDTIYPRIKNNLSDQDLEEAYTPLHTEIQWAERKSRGNVQQLGLLVLIKLVQKLGFFPQFLDIPQPIIHHIANKAFLPIPTMEIWNAYGESRTYERHYHFVRDYLKIHPFNEQARQIIFDVINELSSSKDDCADLINAAIEELIHQRYELPVYNTLKDMANKVRRKSYHLIYEQVFNTLSTEQKESIDQLFQIKSDSTYSAWKRIKDDVKRATLSQLRDLISHRDWLLNQHIPTDIFQVVPLIKVQQMAAEAKTLDAYRMMEMEPKKKYTLAISLLFIQLSKILDDIGEMLIKRMMSIHKKGRQCLQEYKKKTQKRTDSLVETLHDLLIAYQTEGLAEERIDAMKTVLENKEDQVLQDCENHLAFSGDNYYSFLWRFFASHRATLFKILNSISLRSTNQDKSMEEVISFLLSHQFTRKEWIPVARIEKKGAWKREVTPLLDLSWISDAWWRWTSPIKKKKGIPEEINRRHFEVCVFSQIMWELKAGDLYIEGSEKYADYRKQLISWEEYEKQLLVFCKQVNHPSCGSEFVRKMYQELQSVAQDADSFFPNNEQVRIENGEVVIKKLVKRKYPPQLKELESYIYKKLEPINVLDVLADTEHWLNWTRFFSPISGYDAKLNHAVDRYITNVFCYGCNLGPTQTARSLSTFDRKQIAWINQRHVTSESLDKAIQYIINAYNQFDLPKYWGDGKSASADGTKWDLYEQNLLSENHIRYGGYGGIGYYHVSDTYIALFSNFIPCGVWEGVYILDALMNDKVEIRPEIIHSDTQG